MMVALWGVNVSIKSDKYSIDPTHKYALLMAVSKETSMTPFASGSFRWDGKEAR